MFVIANPLGLVLLVLSGIVGVGVFVGTKSASAGLLVIGAAWLLFGGRRIHRETGQRQPGAALFFLPMRWLAALPLSMALVAVPVDLAMRQREQDPRRPLLRNAAEDVRVYANGGDVELAKALREFMRASVVDGIEVDEYHFLIDTRPDKALILARTTQLREYSESAREELLSLLHMFGTAHLPGRDVYAGVYGFATLGAARTPDGRVQAGKFVDDDLLLGFFGEAGSAVAAADGSPPAR